MRLMQDTWEPVSVRRFPGQNTWGLVLGHTRLEQGTWEPMPIEAWWGAH